MTASLDRRGFVEHQSSWLWSVRENAQTIEPHGIFGMLTYLF